jgi:energy-coupling factor transporter transmembrane protein EcfT
MSGSGLAAVMLMVFAVMVLTSFWRQIVIFLFYLAVTVFCFGVYYIVSIVAYIA